MIPFACDEKAAKIFLEKYYGYLYPEDNYIKTLVPGNLHFQQNPILPKDWPTNAIKPLLFLAACLITDIHKINFQQAHVNIAILSGWVNQQALEQLQQSLEISELAATLTNQLSPQERHHINCQIKDLLTNRIDHLYINLTSAYFLNALLEKADFANTKLDNVNFSGAKLNNADFTNASCKHTSFIHADLQGIKKEGADFTGAYYTIFDNEQASTLFANPVSLEEKTANKQMKKNNN